MKKIWNRDEIISHINNILPSGKVVARHTKDGHFYEVNEGIQAFSGIPPIYPSVTGKLQILKDEGLINYKMNRAIESLKNFIFGLVNLPTIEDIDNACDIASRVSQDILEDAGDIGTRIHDCREAIFTEWIKTGIRPADFTTFIPPEDPDIRILSAIRALQRFCEEKDYIPVACELLVYSHYLKVAGTLDDLGLMREVLDYGNNPECIHESIGNVSTIMDDQKGRHTCMHCGYQYRYQFVLMDLKTSNQFKNHYFFQVALYWKMLWRILGKSYKPERCIILKVSKEDGTYKIEDLLKPSKLAKYAEAMIKTNEGVEFIKSLRKDNQKVVAPLMQL